MADLEQDVPLPLLPALCSELRPGGGGEAAALHLPTAGGHPAAHEQTPGQGGRARARKGEGLG